MGNMAPRQKLRVGRPLTGFSGNTAPVVTITAADATPDFGSPLGSPQGLAFGTYKATAVDAQQGDISASIVWSTADDGVLGTGSTVVLTFTTTSGSPETVLTATATDAFGASGSDTTVVTVP